MNFPSPQSIVRFAVPILLISATFYVATYMRANKESVAAVPVCPVCNQTIDTPPARVMLPCPSRNASSTGGNLTAANATAAQMPATRKAPSGTVPLEGPQPEVVDGKPKLKLFIGITTAFEKSELRLAVRETWLNYHSLWDGDIAYRFFLGQSENPSLQTAAEKESEKYQDMIFLPFIDTYRNLSRKTMWMSKWAVDHYDFLFFLKIDDDTYLRLDRYVAKLQNKPTEKFFYGVAEQAFIPGRDGKWAVSEEEWPSARGLGPPWQHGFIYTMSKDCTTWVADALPTPKIWLEDINTGVILSEHKVPASTMVGVMGSGCAEDMTCSHYSTPESMYAWYQNSLSGPTMCYPSAWPDR